MSLNSLRIFGCAGAVLLSLSAAHATSTLVPIVPMAGSQTGTTGATAISDDNTIAGSWEDSSNVTHGFVGTLSGAYTSFDFPLSGTTYTQARGVNDNSYVTGFAQPGGSGMFLGYEFEREPGGTILTVMQGKGKEAAPLDGVAQQIINSGEFVGNHFNDSTHASLAFTGKNGKWQADLSLPFDTTNMKGRGINKHGTTVGFFSDSEGTHGFILDGNTATQVDYPASDVAYTNFEGINDRGVISGDWGDQNGNIYGFTYDMNAKTFKDIRVPSSKKFVQVFGINNSNLIAVNSEVGEYIYCPHAADECPSSGGTPVTVEDGPAIPATAKSVRTFYGIHKPAEIIRRDAASGAVARAAWQKIVAHLPRGAFQP